MQVQVLGHADIIIMLPLCYIIFSLSSYVCLHLVILALGERLRDYAAPAQRIMVQQILLH